MLSSEFAASQKRLKERSGAVAEKAKQKAEKERILAERRQAQAAALEAERTQRRLAAFQAEEEARLAREADLESNNGVFYQAHLQAVPAPESVAADKGIKRAADKVVLPASAGAALMAQDAYKNGTMFFELTTAAGRKTHAALLEFTAAEGLVALPRKVVRSLWGPNADEQAADGAVQVVYRRLPKGTHAVLQPRSAEFQSDVGDDLRDVLEAALHHHSVLSVGDWIEVRHGGKWYDLRVRELQPEAAVSVIDTDLEVEVHPSVETEERIRAEEEEARQRLEAAARQVLDAARAAEAQAAADAEAHAAREQARQAKAAALPPEPAAEGPEPRVACLFRFPDGSRHSRRFLLSDPLQLAFDFVEAQGPGGVDPGTYRLVTQYPRRVFGARAAGAAAGVVAAGSMGEAGLTGREVLFLEPLIEGGYGTGQQHPGG